MDLGKRLKYFREAKKLSIYKLSQETNVSQGHISDLENGKNQPTIDTLSRLIVPLGITLSEFFNEDGEISVLSEKERELVAIYRIMSDDRAEVYVQLGKFLNQP
ncbi:MAG: helix-turn-helix transcriptional regulator [Lachnospiraceae bacterium]|nr:helix-turn-helix transcriptional regulator [Lachnospiraceae bacterium]